MFEKETPLLSLNNPNLGSELAKSSASDTYLSVSEIAYSESPNSSRNNLSPKKSGIKNNRERRMSLLEFKVWAFIHNTDELPANDLGQNESIARSLYDEYNLALDSLYGKNIKKIDYFKSLSFRAIPREEKKYHSSLSFQNTPWEEIRKSLRAGHVSSDKAGQSYYSLILKHNLHQFWRLPFGEWERRLNWHNSNFDLKFNHLKYLKRRKSRKPTLNWTQYYKVWSLTRNIGWKLWHVFKEAHLFENGPYFNFWHLASDELAETRANYWQILKKYYIKPRSNKSNINKMSAYYLKMLKRYSGEKLLIEHIISAEKKLISVPFSDRSDLKKITNNYYNLMAYNLLRLNNSLSSIGNFSSPQQKKDGFSASEIIGSSNILYFKNKSINNIVNTEVTNLKTNLDLKIKFVSLSNSSTKKSEEKKLSEGYTPELEEDSVITKLKYNKSLFNTLKPLTYEEKNFFGSEINRLNTLISHKDLKKNKNLFYNSYYYKKYMLNFFASMPHLVRVLWAIKAARKFNKAFNVDFNSADHDLATTVLGKQGKDTKLFFKSIEKFLGVDINNYKVLNISIRNLNLINKFSPVGHSQASDLFISDSNIVNSFKPLLNNFNVSLNKKDTTYNKLLVQDSYLVKNLLLQKLILSKYRNTDLRSNLLKIRLSIIFGKHDSKNYSFKFNKNIVKNHNSKLFNNRKSIVKLAKSTQADKKPNLRNLRIILKRFFISRAQATGTRKIEFNKNVRLASEKNNSFVGVNRLKINYNKLPSYRNNFLFKNNAVSSAMPATPKSLIKKSKKAILAKHILKIKKNTKSLRLNLLFWIFRMRAKRRGFFYFKSNSSKIISKVLPTIENANSFYSYFNLKKLPSTIGGKENKVNFSLRKISKKNSDSTAKAKKISRVIKKNNKFSYKFIANKFKIARHAAASASAQNNINNKSGTVILGSPSIQTHNRLRSYMRKNFVNFIVQNYIFNSIWYPQGADYSVFVANSRLGEGTAAAHSLEKEEEEDLVRDSIYFKNTKIISRNKLPFLTLSNRLPGQNNSTALSLYGNIYKVFETNINNYKFKLYPHIFDIKFKTVNRFDFSNKLINLFGLINSTSDALKVGSDNFLSSLKFINKYAIIKKSKINLDILPSLLKSKVFTFGPRNLKIKTQASLQKAAHKFIYYYNYKYIYKNIYKGRNSRVSRVNKHKLFFKHSQKNKFIKLNKANKFNKAITAKVKQSAVSLKLNSKENMKKKNEGLRQSLVQTITKNNRKESNIVKGKGGLLINKLSNFSISSPVTASPVVRTQEQKYNKELINSTINYWLLEQEKQYKRSFMYPHLAMQINYRPSSYQHQINFLKVNQLGFLYSEGSIKKKIIYSQFMEKILQLDRYKYWKQHRTYYRLNNITEYIKKYRKRFKKGYMKKFLSQDIKKYVKFQFKKFLISTYFKQVISNEDNLTSYFFNGFYSKFDYHILKKNFNKSLNASLRNNLKVENVFPYKSKGKKLSIKKYGEIKLNFFNNVLPNKFRRISLNRLKYKKWLKFYNKLAQHKFFKKIINKNRNNKKPIFLILYIFLMDKKLALINFKKFILFEVFFSKKYNFKFDIFEKVYGVKARKAFERTISKNSGHSNLHRFDNLEKVYGKKAIKTLRIRGKRKKNFQIMLKDLKEKYEAYASKNILKYFLFLKWKRISSFRDSESNSNNIGAEFEDLIFDFNANFSKVKSNFWLGLHNSIKSISSQATLAQPVKSHSNFKQANVSNRRVKIKEAVELIINLREFIVNNKNRGDNFAHLSDKNQIFKDNYLFNIFFKFFFNSMLGQGVQKNEKLENLKVEFISVFKLLEKSVTLDLNNEGSSYFESYFAKRFLFFSLRGSSIKKFGKFNYLLNEMFKRVDNFNTLDSYSPKINNNFNISTSSANQGKNNFDNIALAYLGKYFYLHQLASANKFTEGNSLINYNNHLANSYSNSFENKNNQEETTLFNIVQKYNLHLENTSIDRLLIEDKNDNASESTLSQNIFSDINFDSLDSLDCLDCFGDENHYFKANRFFLRSILNFEVKWKNKGVAAFNNNTIAIFKKYNHLMLTYSNKKNILSKLNKYNYSDNKKQVPNLNLELVKNLFKNISFGEAQKTNNVLFNKAQEENFDSVLADKHNDALIVNTKGAFNKLSNRNSIMPSLFKSLESNLITLNNNNPNNSSVQGVFNNYINNFNDFNPVISGSHYNSLYSGAEDNLELSGSVSPFFDFLIDNKNINKLNKLGLRKILSEFKLFRYFRYSGANTGPKQVISYSFTKNINRTNTLNSLDHTGSLLKVSISVILKYFFKIMGLALISKPVFIFSPNKVNIQISYFMNNKIYFSNSSMRNWNETVSTLSMGMQVHWALSNKFYRNISKRNMSDSGKWPSLWKMKYYYLNKKPFNEKVKPFYPGNVPYLSQFKYVQSMKNCLETLQESAGYYSKKKYVKIKKTNKLTGKSWTKVKPQFTKKCKNLRPADIRKIKYSKPFVRNTLSFFYDELNSLSYILEKFFNCPIKLELNRIKLPYSDTNIMAQLIGINGEEYDFNTIKNKFIYNLNYRNPNKSEFKLKKYNGFKPFFIGDMDSYLTLPSGYKVRVAGRFYKHKIIPRKTVTEIQYGSLARGVVNLVEKSRYVNKSKRGSFSITVWISHNF